MTLALEIRNSGSLPATNIQSNITFFHVDESVTKDNVSSQFQQVEEKEASPSAFPNASFIKHCVLDLTDRNDSALWEQIQEGTVKMRLRITYESLRRKHLTIQTEEITQSPWAVTIQLKPVLPRLWK
ncbi:hypothetical protein ACFLUB_02075 [Chloroflexota bacterium]